MIRRMLKTLPGAVKLYHSMRYKFHAQGLTKWQPLVPERAFEDCVRNALQRLLTMEPAEALGDYLEFGVSRGTSAVCVNRVLQELGLDHVRLIGFDSFEGMPPEAANEGWAPGQYSSTIHATRRYLKSHDVDLNRVTLVKGWFDATLNPDTRRRHKIGKASLVMIDCDTYSASKVALDFSEHHIHERAVIMFDDWGGRAAKGLIGQQEAFAEFLEKYPTLSATALPSYLPPQAHVFLLERSTAQHRA